ncbi:helix-turn-helix transcriptional regulator [Phaeobacter marinintestinus]|uniref:helix-turn-helix transcriptional regulator n=1 Tax=Falsiphaeobacter marinintestinus TaxID=1492905 RepID=UPI001FE87FD4|nr:AlpA family phage regulatory protein [Phaeobacter marinintestinus]
MGIKLSNSSLLRAEARGAFPRRLRISAATVCWDRAEVNAWLQARKSERATWQYADPS